MSYCYVAVKEDEIFTVRELYFGRPYSHDPKKIMGWSSQASAASGTTKEDLIQDLKQMISDIEQSKSFALISGELKELE